MSAPAEGQEKAVGARWSWVLGLVLLAPVLVAITLLLWRELVTKPLLAPFDEAAVTRIEIARSDRAAGQPPLILERVPGGEGWRIVSAADAPADKVRIEALLRNLAGMRGQGAARPPADKPVLAVRLLDGSNRQLGAAAFRSGIATRLPDGPVLNIRGNPSIPDWPSGWTTLQAPRIDVSRVVAVESLGPEGAVRLPPAAVGETVGVLLALDAQDFTGGDSVRWMGAKMRRILLDDGSVIDVQQVPDGEGRYFIRLTSATVAAARDARRYAFRVEKPLP